MVWLASPVGGLKACAAAVLFIRSSSVLVAMFMSFRSISKVAIASPRGSPTDASRQMPEMHEQSDDAALIDDLPGLGGLAENNRLRRGRSLKFRHQSGIVDGVGG